MSRLVWAVWVAAAAATVWFTFTDADTALRPVVTLAFLALGPGWALVGGLRDTDVLTRVSLALGLSVAIDLLVAQAMLTAGVWSPQTGLLGVLAPSAVGLSLQARRAVRRRRTWRHIGEVLPPATARERLPGTERGRR